MPYPERQIHEGGSGTFVCAADIPIYSRIKFVAPVATNDPARIDIAGIADETAGIIMVPGVSGQPALIRFMSAAGSQRGLAAADITPGTTVYSAASGKLGSSSSGGALKLGVCETRGVNGQQLTWTRT